MTSKVVQEAVLHANLKVLISWNKQNLVEASEQEKLDDAKQRQQKTTESLSLLDETTIELLASLEVDFHDEFADQLSKKNSFRKLMKKLNSGLNEEKRKTATEKGRLEISATSTIQISSSYTSKSHLILDNDMTKYSNRT